MYFCPSVNGAAMKTRRISASLLFPLLLGLSLSSCGPIRSLLGGSGANGDPSASTQFTALPEGFIQDESGQMQISLPDGWIEEKKFHRSAGLQAYNEASDLYVIALAESKDVIGQFSLEVNSGFYRKLLIENLDRFEDQAQTEVTVINSNSALQYEIWGEIEGAKVTYLHTTVVTDSMYYQIVAWTHTNRYASRKSELQNVVGTFRAI